MNGTARRDNLRGRGGEGGEGARPAHAGKDRRPVGCVRRAPVRQSRFSSDGGKLLLRTACSNDGVGFLKKTKQNTGADLPWAPENPLQPFSESGYYEVPGAKRSVLSGIGGLCCERLRQVRWVSA